MANLHKPATCHPDRLHVAKGLCRQCYSTRHHAANREAHNAYMRSYAKSVRLGLRKRRPAPCHPDRPHFALELCSNCYHSSAHGKALRAARVTTKPRDTAVRAPLKFARPAPTWASIRVSVGARTIAGVVGVTVKERGGAAASFFARKSK